MLVSDNAILQLKSLLKENEYFRVSVTGGGCAGLKIDFEVTKKYFPDANGLPDLMILNQDNVKVISDAKTAKLLEDGILDFKTGLANAGFYVIVENAQYCGCKISFSLL